jgi:hypothetical protein
MTTMHDVEAPVGEDTQKRALGKRLDRFGWGLFLIMTGVIWLVPEQRVPPGTWLIGTGILLLGVNWIRHLKGIGVSGFTTFLGAVALAAGLGDALGMRLPILAICFIAIGASILLRPLLTRAP